MIVPVPDGVQVEANALGVQLWLTEHDVGVEMNPQEALGLIRLLEEALEEIDEWEQRPS